MNKNLIAYCGVDCSVCGECNTFPCADMIDFYKESESHEQAYELMLSMRENN